MLAKTNKLPLFAFLITVFFVGTNFVAVKYSNEELSPFWGAFLRFFIASIVLYLFSFTKRIPIPIGKALFGSVVYGVLGFGLAYALSYWALLKVSAGIASITFSLVPLFTFFLAVIQGLERFNTRILFGSIIAALGITIIFINQINGVSILPLFALIAAALCIAESGIVVKIMPKIHPVALNAFGMFVGSIILLIFSFLTNEVKTIPSYSSTLLAILYLVLLGTIALFLLWIFVLKHWSATTTSYQLVLAPIITLVLANILRGEPISTMTILGGVIVISGVYLGAISLAKK